MCFLGLKKESTWKRLWVGTDVLVAVMFMNKVFWSLQSNAADIKAAVMFFLVFFVTTSPQQAKHNAHVWHIITFFWLCFAFH